jgi:hypothetical protein
MSLNVITLGQIINDHINRMKTITMIVMIIIMSGGLEIDDQEIEYLSTDFHEIEGIFHEIEGIFQEIKFQQTLKPNLT